MSQQYDQEYDLDMVDCEGSASPVCPYTTVSFSNKLAADKGHVRINSDPLQTSRPLPTHQPRAEVSPLRESMDYEVSESEPDVIVLSKLKRATKIVKKSNVPRPMKETRMLSSTALLT